METFPGNKGAEGKDKNEVDLSVADLRAIAADHGGEVARERAQNILGVLRRAQDEAGRAIGTPNRTIDEDHWLANYEGLGKRIAELEDFFKTL